MTLDLRWLSSGQQGIIGYMTEDDERQKQTNSWASTRTITVVLIVLAAVSLLGYLFR